MDRTPRYFYDASEGVLVAVPLQYPGKEVVLTAPHYERLIEKGFGSRFTLNDNGRGRAYVRGWFDGRKVMVSRYVAGAAQGEVVHYRDGNPLNLLPGNLILESGRGRSDCRFSENF